MKNGFGGKIDIGLVSFLCGLEKSNFVLRPVLENEYFFSFSCISLVLSSI